MATSKPNFLFRKPILKLTVMFIKWIMEDKARDCHIILISTYNNSIFSFSFIFNFLRFIWERENMCLHALSRCRCMQRPERAWISWSWCYSVGICLMWLLGTSLCSAPLEVSLETPLGAEALSVPLAHL